MTEKSRQKCLVIQVKLILDVSLTLQRHFHQQIELMASLVTMKPMKLLSTLVKAMTVQYLLEVNLKATSPMKRKKSRMRITEVT